MPDIDDPRPLIARVLKELRDGIDKLSQVTKRVDTIGRLSLATSIISLIVAIIALFLSATHH